MGSGEKPPSAGTAAANDVTPKPGSIIITTQDAAEFKPTRDFFLAFLALCTLNLALAFDATSLGVALPAISTALGGTAIEAFWSGTSFLLASTVLQPTFASLSSIFGRKGMIYVACVFFAAGSLLAALAGDFTVLIAGRTVQGVGGGGLIAITEIVVTDLVPLRFRGQWMSLLSVVWSIGTVTGPLIGAGFAEKVSWRWIFYINLPIIGVGTVFIVLFLHQTRIPGDLATKLRRFDYAGSLLFTASVTAFLFGLTTGGVMYPWASFRVLLPLLLGPAGMVAFMAWELRGAAEPLISRGIFNNRDMIVSYVMVVCHGAILWSLLYFLVLYYQAVKFYSPITSAVAVLPQTLTVAPGGLAVGLIVAKTGHYRWSLWTGWVLTTFGAGILLLLGPQTTVVQWIWINIPIGLGCGMLYPAVILSIQAACAPALNGQAAAFFSFLRGLGQSVGVATSGVIFQNVFKQKLQGLGAFAALADAYSRDATIVVGVINAMPDGADKTDLVQAYSDSLRMVWVSILAFAATGLMLGSLVKGYSLDSEHVTEQGLSNRAINNAERNAEAGTKPPRI
ncbi:major facilitator superfamily transporter [Podospora appendiculata]|uniref:Major facilitator superfamily transporter n=1 Tax=Podospora appendiculata TaxID=314037 RepID=A0AAE1CGE0_9PEZI|nr:major facilitator superfamily transporter [Podospora appendiculata]